MSELWVMWVNFEHGATWFLACMHECTFVGTLFELLVVGCLLDNIQNRVGQLHMRVFVSFSSFTPRILLITHTCASAKG